MVVRVRIHTHTSRERDGLHTSSKRKLSQGPIFSVAVWFSLPVSMLIEGITLGAEAGDRRGQRETDVLWPRGPGPSRCWRGQSRVKHGGLCLMGIVTPFLGLCGLCSWAVNLIQGGELNQHLSGWEERPCSLCPPRTLVSLCQKHLPKFEYILMGSRVFRKDFLVTRTLLRSNGHGTKLCLGSVGLPGTMSTPIPSPLYPRPRASRSSPRTPGHSGASLMGGSH